MKKLAVLLIALVLLSGCSRLGEVKRSGFYIDNLFEAKLKYKKDRAAAKKAEQGINNAFNSLVQMDTNLNKLSTISEIYAINTMAGMKGIEVSAETYNLIKKGITGSILTDGYFDITWEPLTRLFSNGHFPTSAEVNKAKANIGYLNVILDKNFNKVRFANLDVKINLDRIKKGYALDMMTQEMAKRDIVSGYVKTKDITSYLGHKKEKIRLTEKKEVKLNVSNRSIVVLNINNDDYLKNSKYWVNFLPVTVSDNAIEKIVVVAPNAVTAEVLANAFFFMGPERSLELIKAMKTKVDDPDMYNVIFVLNNDGTKATVSSLKR